MSNMAIKEDRPSYVRFEKRPIEDRAASLANGHFTTADVDFAIITPHGTTDEIPRIAKDWFVYLDQSSKEERIPKKFVDYYRECYEHFLKGEEIPLKGTPIKDWPPLSPSQRQNLISVRVYTVEDLANANEATLGLMGMGARELQQKAANWLQSATDLGKITEQISALQVENKRLAATVDQQATQLQAMKERELAAAEAYVRPNPIAEKAE